MQSTSDTGVLSWITSGRCDLVADIRFPREDTELDLSALVDHLVDEIGERLSPSKDDSDSRIPGRRSLSRDALQAPRDEDAEQVKKEERLKALRFAKETEKAAAAATLGEVEDDDEDLHVGEDEEDRIVSIDLDIRFKDLKASVPVRFVSLHLTMQLSLLTSHLL